MAKRKKKPQEKSTRDIGDVLMMALLLLFPLGASSLAAYVVISVLPSTLPLWAATPVAYLIGVPSVILGSIMAGGDVGGVLVSSVFIAFIALSCLL